MRVIFKIATNQPQGDACHFCLIFCQFQPVVAYKSVAYRKNVYVKSYSLNAALVLFDKAFHFFFLVSCDLDRNMVAAATQHIFCSIFSRSKETNSLILFRNYRCAASKLAGGILPLTEIC